EHAMTARRGFGCVAIRCGELVSGKVERAVVERVGSLRRLAARRKRCAELAQTIEIFAALLAERPQRSLADLAPGLELEILAHRLGRVLEPGLPLKLGTAAGIDDASAASGRAAAVEAIDDQDRGSGAGGLDRRRCARGS